MYSYFRKILFLLPKNDPWKLFGLFLMMLIAALFEIIGIGLIPAFVSVISDPSQLQNYKFLSSYTNQIDLSDSQNILTYGAFTLISVFIVKNSYIVCYYFFETRFVYNRRYYISKNLVNHYLSAPYSFFLQRNSSELLRNVTQEVGIFISKVLKPTLEMIKELVVSISIIVFLIIFEPLITLFVIILLGSGTGIFLIITQRKIKRYGKEEQGIRNTMIKAVNEGVGGIKEARVLNREKEFANRFNDSAYRSSKLMSYVGFASKVPKPVVETIAVTGMMMIAFLMVWQGREMISIIPTLTLFAMATIRMMPSIQGITSTYTQLRYNIVSIEPLYKDLKELKLQNESFKFERSRNEILKLNNQLVIKDLIFTYEKSTLQALNNINLSIRKGSAVAFAGASGAGKSTLIDLILGLVSPTRGQIFIDETDLSTNISGWQKNIGYIPQFIFLSDDSVRANIAFGIPYDQIDDNKVLKAIELAQLSEMIENLPNGVNTIIGEKGTRISGGQRQRVGIARALYNDPQIIIMDEATSALDNVTEKYIIESIEKLKGERTIIMIAHRLTTVMNCDIIHFMENGHIVNSGTFDELIQINSNFKKMALKT